MAKKKKNGFKQTNGVYENEHWIKNGLLESTTANAKAFKEKMHVLQTKGHHIFNKSNMQNKYTTHTLSPLH